MHPTVARVRRFLLFAPTMAVFGLAAWGGGLTPPQAPAPAVIPGAAKAAWPAQNWPMHGGNPSRNYVNPWARNLPETWDVATGKNVKWVADLGTQAYGEAVVAGGRVFVGTNNSRPRDPAAWGDRGVLMCFREADGLFLWQTVHEKLASGRVNDWPEQGIASMPCVVGDRLYYVSNRCELICAAVETGRPIWRLDMMKDLGVFPHNLAASSPLVVGDLVFLHTGNGHDESHERIPAPNAPSFLCVDRHTGRVVWQDNSPGKNILHAQWSSPTLLEVGGQSQILFPGGDGWLRAFEPRTGKLLWKFDCNPKKSFYKLGGRGTRNYFVGAATVANGKVYIATGQDPEHGDGVGHLWCIDPTRASPANVDLSPVNDNFDPQAPENRSSGLVWHFGGADAQGNLLFHRTMSGCAVHDGLCFVTCTAGWLFCLDAESGRQRWEYDLLANVWGGPFVADGKVYLGTDEGDVCIFSAAPACRLLGKFDMGISVLGTPVAANGVLYVKTKNRLFALANR